jgi:hypothetical protein
MLPPLGSHKEPAAGAQGARGPLQLLRVSKCEGGAQPWRYELNEEALSVLQGYGHRPIRVCTICGPSRSGKSYLLNLLLGQRLAGEGKFEVASSTRSCTQGVWMWAGADENHGESVLFLDCEGFGSVESNRTRDATLMALCTLLSSVFVLNTKGVLSEGLFNELSLVSHFSRHIQESRHEASRPALLWVLRDFVVELRDASGREITAEDYLEQALHARPLAGVDAERSRSAVEVRDALMKLFPSRHCATLVQPVIDEAKLRKLDEVPSADLRPEFQRQAAGLRSQLMELARACPKTVAGQPVSAIALASMLRKFADALNSGHGLNLTSAWETFQHNACSDLAFELRESAAATLRKVREEGAAVGGAPSGAPPGPGRGGRPLPVPDDELAKFLKRQRQALKESFRSRAVGDAPVREEYWRELREGLAAEERAVEARNRELAEVQLQAALEQWSAWLADSQGRAWPDPRAAALPKLLESGLPAGPVAAAACEALIRARHACLLGGSSGKGARGHDAAKQGPTAWLEAGQEQRPAAAGEEGAEGKVRRLRRGFPAVLPFKDVRRYFEVRRVRLQRQSIPLESSEAPIAKADARANP